MVLPEAGTDGKLAYQRLGTATACIQAVQALQAVQANS